VAILLAAALVYHPSHQAILAPPDAAAVSATLGGQ
jgi:hypothetical protein